MGPRKSGGRRLGTVRHNIIPQPPSELELQPRIGCDTWCRKSERLLIFLVRQVFDPREDLTAFADLVTRGESQHEVVLDRTLLDTEPVFAVHDIQAAKPE